MIRFGKIFCDFCNLEIGLQKYKVMKAVLADGKMKQVHYHDRDADDCFSKEVKRVAERNRVPNVPRA